MIKVDDGREERPPETIEREEVAELSDDIINFSMPNAQQFQDT
jgi:hypothetical protein